jgi:hypothetical protein
VLLHDHEPPNSFQHPTIPFLFSGNKKISTELAMSSNEHDLATKHVSVMYMACFLSCAARHFTETCGLNSYVLRHELSSARNIFLLCLSFPIPPHLNDSVAHVEKTVMRPTHGFFAARWLNASGQRRMGLVLGLARVEIEMLELSAYGLVFLLAFVLKLTISAA